MEKTNADVLIDRIEDAKDWLEKAQVEYKNSNPVRGGLILNLAQAEVKHAWELSHQQYVSKTVTPLNREPSYHSKRKYILPIAASLIVVTGLGVGIRLSGVLAPAQKQKAVPMVQTNHPQEISRKPENMAVSKTTSPSKTVSETEQKYQTVAQTHLTPSSTPVVQPAAAMKQNNLAESYTNAAAIRNGSNIVDEKPVLKPVSKLSIDEDALTKEASHSLRIGK